MLRSVYSASDANFITRIVHTLYNGTFIDHNFWREIELTPDRDEALNNRSTEVWSFPYIELSIDFRSHLNYFLW